MVSKAAAWLSSELRVSLLQETVTREVSPEDEPPTVISAGGGTDCLLHYCLLMSKASTRPDP